MSHNSSAAFFAFATAFAFSLSTFAARPPLSLTSDKSAECYRNWWPGPGDAMVAAMNRSIDLLEELARESGNVMRLNRRGYLYATADPARVPALVRAADEAAALGAGPARRPTGPRHD